MSILFDGIIVLVCLTTIILGIRRGFIKSVMSVCTLVAALFAAFAFTPAVSSYIAQTSMIQDISDSITDTIKSVSVNDSGTYDLHTLFQEMVDPFQQIVDRYHADEEQLTETISPSDGAAEDTVQALGDLIAKPVVDALSGVLAFLGIFCAAVIVLKLITWILDMIFQLPVLKTTNTLLGFLFGLVGALIWAWILSALSISFIGAMSSVAPEYFSDSVIEHSLILTFFRGNHFLEIINSLLY